MKEIAQECTGSIRVLGHWLYVRKCIKPDIMDVDGRVLLYLHEKTKEDTQWAEVLAKGDKCGTRRKFQAERQSDRVPHMVNEIKIGDLVMCPNNHPWGIMRSPVSEFEFFVDECVPLAVYREPKEGG